MCRQLDCHHWVLIGIFFHTLLCITNSEDHIHVTKAGECAIISGMHRSELLLKDWIESVEVASDKKVYLHHEITGMLVTSSTAGLQCCGGLVCPQCKWLSGWMFSCRIKYLLGFFIFMAQHQRETLHKQASDWNLDFTPTLRPPVLERLEIYTSRTHDMASTLRYVGLEWSLFFRGHL